MNKDASGGLATGTASVPISECSNPQHQAAIEFVANLRETDLLGRASAFIGKHQEMRDVVLAAMKEIGDHTKNIRATNEHIRELLDQLERDFADELSARDATIARLEREILTMKQDVAFGSSAGYPRLEPEWFSPN
jgi:hypothetical protein